MGRRLGLPVFPVACGLHRVKNDRYFAVIQQVEILLAVASAHSYTYTAETEEAQRSIEFHVCCPEGHLTKTPGLRLHFHFLHLYRGLVHMPGFYLASWYFSVDFDLWGVVKSEAKRS